VTTCLCEVEEEFLDGVRSGGLMCSKEVTVSARKNMEAEELFLSSRSWNRSVIEESNTMFAPISHRKPFIIENSLKVSISNLNQMPRLSKPP
jgi:hypothetical protein